MEKMNVENYQAVFAERLGQLITAHGMSPKDFAIEMGIPDVTIYRYLHAQRTPKIDNILRFALYFNVSIDWMMGLPGDMHERWSESTIRVAQQYTMASPDDRRVVDMVLAKYKGGNSE